MVNNVGLREYSYLCNHKKNKADGYDNFSGTSRRDR